MKIDATTLRDVSDHFEFLESNLEYYDAPIAGYVKHKTSGQLFAFDCAVVVTDRVVHWCLVPVHQVGDDASGVVRDNLVRGATEWISILEDRRRDEACCMLVPMPAHVRPAQLSSGALIGST